MTCGGTVGPGWAWVRIFLTPLPWSVPIGLAVLAHALPVLAGSRFTTDPALWRAQTGWAANAARCGATISVLQATDVALRICSQSSGRAREAS